MGKFPLYVLEAQKKYVTKFKSKGKSKSKKIPLTPKAYFNCFHLALTKMAEVLYGRPDNYQLDFIERDGKITNTEAAKDDFYSHFSYKSKDDREIVCYQLTSAFFQYSYNGLYFPQGVQRRQSESQLMFLRDCATNYLLKNFWHNHVHERAQRITSANYHEFADEARYDSDFEADNLANVLLALSYGHTVGAATSHQTDIRQELSELFARNRCNRVFPLRAQARQEDVAPTTFRKFQEADWLNRRRFATSLSVHLLERNRAAATLSMHFFGEAKKAGGIHKRNDSGMSVELNGVRIRVPRLGDITNVRGEQFRRGADAIVQHVDTEYSGLLRKDSDLKRFARVSLTEKIRLLTSPAVSRRVTV